MLQLFLSSVTSLCTNRSEYCGSVSVLHVLTAFVKSSSLILIQPTFIWTLWDTLWCHSCLSRAAASACSEVSPSLCSSSLTVPLQFVLGCLVLCQIQEPYSIMLALLCANGPSILNDQTSAVLFLCLHFLSFVVEFLPWLVHFVILSFQETFNMLLCHLLLFDHFVLLIAYCFLFLQSEACLTSSDISDVNTCTG